MVAKYKYKTHLFSFLKQKVVISPALPNLCVQIQCKVLAEPAPDVNWKRGKKILSGHEQVRQDQC
jgi:hypothetical protein